MTFASNIISAYGNRGKEWLQSLPQISNSITKKYNIIGLSPVGNLSYNYVCTGTQENLPIILKLGLDTRGIKQEAKALKAFTGLGAVEIIAEDEGLLILKRATPGTSLKTYFPLRDQQAIEIACRMMATLHRAPVQPNNFPHIDSWLKKLDRDWDIPTPYLQKARALRDMLLSETREEVLLHGDLHHDNILQDGTGWVVIDPKGVIGPRVYEVWAFLNNPEPMRSRLIEGRVKLFGSILNMPPEQILKASFVQSVLSWTWDLEDNIKPSSIWITEILDRLTA